MQTPECMYCAKNEALHAIMLPICEIGGFPLYLFRNQVHRGRAVLAYPLHTGSVAEMEESGCTAFFAAAYKAVRALHVVFSPAQINLGMFGDTVRHCHLHLVPKYENGPDFGGVFCMNPQPEAYLSAEAYAKMANDIRAALDHQ